MQHTNLWNPVEPQGHQSGIRGIGADVEGWRDHLTAEGAPRNAVAVSWSWGQGIQVGKS